MAFSRKGISREEESKCLMEMALEPTPAFGRIVKARPFE